MSYVKRGVFPLLLLCVLVLSLLGLTGAASTRAVPANHGVPGFQHVFIVMMENTGYNTLIGNPNAPFINATANSNGFAQKYFGVTHPSQPNYIAATSGSTNGVTGDGNVTVNATNIVDQLESAGKSWKAYMQSYSLCSTPLDTTCGNQLYERKHNPFISYQDVQSNPARVAKIVDFSQFTTDLANGSVPNYAWISPDQCHDMHGRSDPGDACDFSNEQGLIATGDAFLKSTVNQIMNSQTWQNSNSAIFIQWDESDFTGTGFQGYPDDSGCCDSVPGQGGGHIISMVLLSENQTARTSQVAYNHYSMLATLEDGWNLSCLGFTCDTANVKPMTDLVNQNG